MRFIAVFTAANVLVRAYEFETERRAFS